MKKKVLYLLALFGSLLLLLSVFLVIRQERGNKGNSHMSQSVSTATSSQEEQKSAASSQEDKQAKLLPNQSIVKKSLSVKRDNYEIYGQLTAPQGYENHRLPLIIFSHGFGNTLEFGDVYAEALAQKGYLVYSFDFVGGSPSSRSGGSMLEMSVFTEKSDLDAVLSQLKKETYVDSNYLFLMGFSQGGVVSTMTALEHQDDIKGLIAVNAAFVLFDDARKLFASVEDIPDEYNHRGTRLGKVYFENLLDYDIYQKMPQLTKPVLLIQGTADDVVSLSYAKRAQKAFPNASLKEIKDGDHIFNQQENDQVIEAIEAYLSQQLNS